MLERTKITIAHGLQAVTGWADPNWWVCLSVLLLLLCLVHPVPLRLPDVHIYSFKAHVAVWVRRGLWVALVLLGLMLPLVAFVAFGAIARSSHQEAANLFTDWAKDQLGAYWTMPLGASGLGLLISFLWYRYASPYLSNMARRYRVNQGEGEPSDVKKEAQSLATKNYDPRKHYKPGYYFVGLDNKNLPIYVPDADFHDKMVAVLGPTGVGKGSWFQYVLDQSIDKGNRTFYIDPKDDDNIPFVMAQAAERNKRPFIYLDLNPSGTGNWHPFKGGTQRDRRARIIGAFKLAAAGSDADVYKAAERRCVDKLLAKTDGSIRQMLDLVEADTADKELNTLRDSLTEWASISTFVPAKKNRGHSIEQSLRNNAVVYVRGSTDDDVVRLATRCYIQELTQEIKRLKAELTGHTFLNVDEVRFVMSKELVDSLATIRSSRANIACGTQSIGDLRSVSDRDIDKSALQQSFTINCQIKLIYKAGDDETAEWGEKLGGKTWIRTPSMERTEVNRWGGEDWGENRSMKKEEVPLISVNKLLMLPQRVGIFYYPGQIAQTLFSGYVPLEDRTRTWERPKIQDKPTSPEHDAASETALPNADEQAPMERGIDLHKL